MFLHSGVAMHSHEYSAPADARRNSLPRRSPLTRSAFSTPLPRRVSTYDRPSPNLLRPAAPIRPVSEYTPRPTEAIVRFQEPDDTMSEDGRSVANSEGSEATARGGRRRRRSTRTSSAFHLAHPAPTLTQKQRLLHIRPRLLLQLQRISTESRPKPVIDVVPSTVVVPRLVKKFARMFRGKAELGANDVMVVRSEDYDTLDDHIIEDTDSDEEGFANRDLVAVICQMRKDSGGAQGKAEIVLNDGSVWMATPLPNGLYEFSTIDEQGNKVTARWVRRSIRHINGDSPGINDFKFTFSIIDPNSRRHPIMATITNYTLDIPDTYTSVSSSAGKYPPTSPLRSLPGDPQFQPTVEEPNPERTTHVIDESMKTLIQVTGIWVALRQGLSPYFKYNDAMASGATSSPIQRNASVGSRMRPLSIPLDIGRSSPAGTATNTPDSAHSTFGGRILQKRVRGSPSSTSSPLFDHAAHPKRSMSSGSAFMQRAAARKAGNLPTTLATDSEGEGVFFPPKRSFTEDLRGSLPNQSSTPQQDSVLGSSVPPIETPTKPQRRTQSVYIPPVHQNEVMNGNPARHSVEVMDGKELPDSVEKPKTSRWKAFKDFFRRSRN